MNADEGKFLSWQGTVSGPHPLEQIRAMLKEGRIHSLYRIQVNGEWVLLRDHLAGISRAVRAVGTKGGPPPLPEARGMQRIPPQPQVPRVVDEEPQALLPVATLEGDGGGPGAGTMRYSGPTAGADQEAARGFALTSFVLSLLFFLPGLSLVGWVMSLIFGHMALNEERLGRRVGQSWMAWFGVWMSYIMGGMFFVLIGLFVLGGQSLASFSESGMLFQLHGVLISQGLMAAINGGLLLWAVKLLTGEMPAYSRCYIPALLSISVDSLTTEFTLGFFGIILPELDTSFYVVAGAAAAAFWAVQAAIWGEMVRRKDGSRLGFGNAAVASVFSMILIGFISFVTNLLL